jgi:hypothetical protein
VKKYYNFSFEITHLCNKYCDGCSHRIKESDYKYLTINEYEKIFQAIKHLPISEIEITGGEPFLHPDFNELINRVFNDFPASRIILVTNGKLISSLNPAERNRFDRIYITWYKGFNETEITKVVNEKNVFINRENFIKFDDSKKLDVSESKKIFKYCSHKVDRFIGTRLYFCCLAESIERVFLSNRISLDVSEVYDWHVIDRRKDLYKACEYCIFAKSVSEREKLRCIIHLIKQFILLSSPLAKYKFKLVWQIWRHRKNKKNWYKYQSRLNKNNIAIINS